MLGRQLDIDMRGHGEFMARIADYDFAVNVYCVLLNADWYHVEGSRWAASWRSAGGIVAQWRDADETYLDFYMADFFAPASVSFPLQTEAIDLFARAGWRKVTPKAEAEFYSKALTAITSLERLPPGKKPDWHLSHHATQDWDAHDPRMRLSRLAENGMLGEIDYLHLLRSVHGLSAEARAIVTGFAINIDNEGTL